MAKKIDKYVNVGYGFVIASGANALTFDQIQFAIGVFQGVAIVLHKVLWYPSPADLRELVAATDTLMWALCTSNRLNAITDTSDPSIITHGRMTGVGVAVESHRTPFVDDMTGLPGGGRIIAPNPLYVAIHSAGFTGISSMRVELQFTFMELSDADYIELIQSQLPANI